MSKQSLNQIFEKYPAYSGVCSIIERIEAHGEEAYLVGGAVRDALLGREVKDFDLATSVSTDQISEIFKNEKKIPTGVKFGTWTLSLGGFLYEVTTYRGDEIYKDGRRPEDLKFVRDKKKDLERRDFTINAMMFHPKQGLYDPFEGEKDIREKTIKTVGEPSKRFLEDHLRILRAFRFSLNLDFSVEQKTLELAVKNISKLKTLSKERVFSEIKKVFQSDFKLERLENLLKVVLSYDVDLSAFKNKKRDLFWKTALSYKVGFKIIELPLQARSDFFEKKWARCIQFYHQFENAKTSLDCFDGVISFMKKENIYADQAQDFFRALSLLDSSFEKKIRKENLPLYSKEQEKDWVKQAQKSHEGREIGQAVLQFKRDFLFKEKSLS